MRGKVIVGDGEEIGHALQRLRRQVCREKALDKWPVWTGHHATTGEVRRRKLWLRAAKRKWIRIQAEIHRGHTPRYPGDGRA